MHASKENSSQAGLSLVECAFAMIVTMVGVMALSGLIAYGMRLQVVSRHATAANALAKAKIEELRTISPNVANSARAPGGSLTENLGNHFDFCDGGFTRRWEVTAGPAGTQMVTVIVFAGDMQNLAPEVRVQALLPIG